MVKLYESDAEAFCKTILVGLPAVGKSTIADTLCERFEQDTGIKLENVSSDLRFREVRQDKNNPVVKKFMQEHNIPEEDFPLLIKTTNFMKKYGEPCFRDFEADVIADMLEKGEFKGKIPNLGGKAILHPKTAAAFKKAGYNIIYLKSDINNVTAHVTGDFEKNVDGELITRSNINDPILEHLEKQYPDIAKLTPRRCAEQAVQKSIENLRNTLARRKIRLSELASPKEMKAFSTRYHKRIEARDTKAKEIMTTMSIQRDAGYEKAANTVVKVSGNLENDLQTIIGVIRKSNVSQIMRKTQAQARA